MNDIAIRVENISKQYRIGSRQKRYRALRDVLTDAARAPFRQASKFLRGQATGAAKLDQTIWALKDVSLEIKQGDVVGIIGSNGAGKSTLLKILSRITEPTDGYAEIHGRVGSLLEVGTGFHPELTGRENVYLNGAILGMRNTEIEHKFDEIVAFAEVEKFLDTPMKHYSTGMYLRLAFSVAAHLEPEILLVDEVLAVGDAAFQKKCLGKMETVAKEGRTVLFVSHNMTAVENLCKYGVVLQNGIIVKSSHVGNCIQYYLDQFNMEQKTSLADRKDRTGSGKIRLTEVFFERAGNRISTVRTGKPCNVCFKYTVEKEQANVSIAFTIRDHRSQFLIRPSSADVQPELFRVSKDGTFRCKINRLPLIPGRYRITATVTINDEVADYIEGAAFMLVEEGDFFRTGRLSLHSPVLLDHSWDLAV